MLQKEFIILKRFCLDVFLSFYGHFRLKLSLNVGLCVLVFVVEHTLLNLTRFVGLQLI